MKIYCTECGTPMEYAQTKPRFCMNCGYNFETKSSAQPSSPQPSPPQESNAAGKDPNSDPDSEEFDVKEIDPRVREMQKLDVEIEINKPKKVSLGDMFPHLNQEGNEGN
jgi:uncharacterized Zn finger protein (UPF0148 family)